MRGIKRLLLLIGLRTRGTKMTRESFVRGSVALALFLYATPILAGIPDSGLLNDVTDRFLNQSATWGRVITGYASWLFWLLATISMVWTFGLMALRRADLAEFFSEFVRFTVATGFFWWLLTNGPAIAMSIINSLRMVGADAGKLPNQLTPSSPITIGFDIVKKAFAGLSWAHPVDNLGIVLISIAVVIAMAVVSANILIALVTAWVMAYAGVFILGFGGARWTSDLAVGYFKAMLGIGLELMTMTLLVSVAVSVIDGFYKKLNGSSIYELLLVLCVCVVLALLIHKLPGRVAALAGGGSGAGIGAGTVMGGAAVAGAAMATGGAALVAGAAGVAGGAQALMAAVAKASRLEGTLSGAGASIEAAGDGAKGVAKDMGVGKGDGSMLAAVMGDEGSPSSTSRMGSHGSAETGNSTLSNGAVSAMEHVGNVGEVSSPRSSVAETGSDKREQNGTKSAVSSTAARVAKVASGTAANLAQGGWDVTKAKMEEMKNSSLDRIGDTVGGKIAAAIHAREDIPDIANQSGVGNSFSAGIKSADPASEVAAFRDRDKHL